MRDKAFIEFREFEKSETRFTCLTAGLVTLAFGLIVATPLLIGLAYHYDTRRARELDNFLNSPEIQYNIGDDYKNYRRFGGPM